MRASGMRDLRHTSLAGQQHGSVDIKVASPCQKLAPEGWASRTLHFLAESGVMAHSQVPTRLLGLCAHPKCPHLLDEVLRLCHRGLVDVGYAVLCESLW